MTHFLVVDFLGIIEHVLLATCGTERQELVMRVRAPLDGRANQGLPVRFVVGCPEEQTVACSPHVSNRFLNGVQVDVHLLVRQQLSPCATEQRRGLIIVYHAAIVGARKLAAF